MAKNNGAGLAIAVGAIAVGALFNRKKKKEAEKKVQEANQRAKELSVELADAESSEAQTFSSSSEERKCPSCGNIDTTGALSCPICFASMSGSANTGFEEY